MALQEKRVTLNRLLKELQPHGTAGFSCAGYSSYYSDDPEDILPWHWHEEMEIIHIVEGKMEVKIPSKSFILEKDECIVINSNILHYAAAIGGCRIHSLVFDPELVSGNDKTVFAKKYMDPLRLCNSFSEYCIQNTDKDKILGYFKKAFEALEHDVYGFEFLVRENLSRICLFLYGKFESQMNAKDIPLNKDNFRTRKMLAYIHENFSDNISLAEIAKAADISERECLRCFQKTLQTSPVQYLLKYRIMQGADMLLKNPTSSISEIASFCGFDSPSNFSKMFKRFYNGTPREYRNLTLDR